MTEKLTIYLAGDSFLDYHNYGQDPFKYVRNIFQKSDLLFFNLETPLTEAKPVRNKAVHIYNPPSSAMYLKNLSKNTVVSLANNHILDCGDEGFKSTTDILNKNSINNIGTKNKFQLLFDINNCPIALFALSEYGPKDKISTKHDKILKSLIKMRQSGIFSIVSIHWGVEYSYYPSPKQRKLAHDLIDNGASLIFGHHPHVFQGYEIYKSAPIIYSLGNFQFGTKYDTPESKYSLIAKITLKHRTRSIEFIPIEIEKHTYPKIITDQSAQYISEHLMKISKALPNLSPSFFYKNAAKPFLKNNFTSWITKLKNKPLSTLWPFLVTVISPYYLKMYFGFFLGIFNNPIPPIHKKTSKH